VKVFVSHDHEDAQRCAPLLRALDDWGAPYYFAYAEDLFGQQLSNRVQAELAQSEVLIRICTRATPRSYWMSIESGAFMGLIADEQRNGRSGRRIVSLILDPGYVREPFDVTTTVIDATDTEHPQWVNAFRAALDLPPLHDLADVARAIYSPPPPARIGRRKALGLGAAGIAAVAAIGVAGLVLTERSPRGKPTTTTTTGSGPTPPSDDPAIKWAYFAGDPQSLNGASISATPVLDNGVLYFGTQQGRLYALRAADRQLLWTYPPLSQQPLPEIARAAVVANGAAYFCAHDAGLFAVSLATGTKLWEQGPEQHIVTVSVTAQPVLANGLIYINDIGGPLGPAFVAVADLKGNEVTSLNPTEPNTFGVSAPLVAGGRVYVGGSDGYVYALDATKSGPEIWRVEAGAARALQLKQPPFAITATPNIADGVVYVGSQDTSVYALDARTGAKRWSFPTNGPITISSPVVAAGLLYIGSNDESLYALDARLGHLMWQYATGDKIAGTPTLADGILYIGSYDKYVHAVDATSGKLIRRYHAGGSVLAQPVVAAGVLHVATMNGWVLAFRLS
jgi:outer membrane protein assembly factor BamB